MITVNTVLEMVFYVCCVSARHTYGSIYGLNDMMLGLAFNKLQGERGGRGLGWNGNR